MTDAEARAELEKLTEEELREAARKSNLREHGYNKQELIDILLGKCPKCDGVKDNMEVKYIYGQQRNIQINHPKPCIGCGQNKNNGT